MKSKTRLPPRIVRVGTAGWSIPRASGDRCPGGGTHLRRYAEVFGCVEINSSFYRHHSAATYAKWAASTPTGFRFSVKVPRTITHDQALKRARIPFTQFLDETQGLGSRRGPILLQLPPSSAFDSRVAERFLEMVRARYRGLLVCEPRHPTWFGPRADALLRNYRVARVAADPPRAETGQVPGGWDGIAYFRLHGTPRTYWSRYDINYLMRLGTVVRRLSEAAEVWCVFDNTASGSAIENAWELQHLLRD